MATRLPAGATAHLSSPPPASPDVVARAPLSRHAWWATAERPPLWYAPHWPADDPLPLCPAFLRRTAPDRLELPRPNAPPRVFVLRADAPELAGLRAAAGRRVAGVPERRLWTRLAVQLPGPCAACVAGRAPVSVRAAQLHCCGRVLHDACVAAAFWREGRCPGCAQAAARRPRWPVPPQLPVGRWTDERSAGEEGTGGEEEEEETAARRALRRWLVQPPRDVFGRHALHLLWRRAGVCPEARAADEQGRPLPAAALRAACTG